MNKLKPGDNIFLSGGYDMNPLWLKNNSGYYAKVITFFNNEIDKRKDDEQLSASIEFIDEIEYKNLKGKYGFIMGRWENQKWDKSGTVHVFISNVPILTKSDITNNNSIWAESHAHYEKISKFISAINKFKSNSIIFFSISIIKRILNKLKVDV